MSKLHFDLVSPERRLMSAEVYQVVVPGEDGDFGVLAQHAPLMSSVRTGVIAVYAEASSAPERLFINGGFAEVNETGLTILAEEAVKVADIDVEAVSKQLGRAREDLSGAKSEGERQSISRTVAKMEAMLAVVAN